MRRMRKPPMRWSFKPDHWFLRVNGKVLVSVHRCKGGYRWESCDGRNTQLAGEKPMRLDRAKRDATAFARNLVNVGAV